MTPNGKKVRTQLAKICKDYPDADCWSCARRVTCERRSHTMTKWDKCLDFVTTLDTKKYPVRKEAVLV